MLINVYTDNMYTKEYAKRWAASAKAVESMYNVDVTVDIKADCTEVFVKRGEIKYAQHIPWYRQCYPGLILRKLAKAVKEEV